MKVFLILALLLPGFAIAKKPNLIYILTDDLGYGDLGCYGQKVVRTPRIDEMAKKGLRFTDHYAGHTVCRPSRLSFLKGQHTGHTAIAAALVEADVGARRVGARYDVKL